jgi:hypothetical protein
VVAFGVVDLPGTRFRWRIASDKARAFKLDRQKTAMRRRTRSIDCMSRFESRRLSWCYFDVRMMDENAEEWASLWLGGSLDSFGV